MSEKIEIDTTVRTVEIISIGTQGPAGPQGPSGEPDYEAINELHTLINSLAASKLDKTEYVQHFRGLFTSYVNLTEAVPSGIAGDYAHVDSGSTFNVMRAVWDTSDNIWIIDAVNVAANTDEMPEGAINLYFKQERVLQSTLAGLPSLPATPIQPTDIIINALAKLQAQFGTWVNGSTIGVYHPFVQSGQLQFRKAHGNLYVRGTFLLSAQIPTNTTLFEITDNSYKPIYDYGANATIQRLLFYRTTSAVSVYLDREYPANAWKFRTLSAMSGGSASDLWTLPETCLGIAI